MLRPCLLAFLALIPPAAISRTKPTGPDVAAMVESSLESATDQVRQLAFDGDPQTHFTSKGDPKRTDHFTLTLDAATPLKSITVTTGRPDGSDALEAGLLEISEDGKAFEEAGKFAEGTIQFDAKGRPIRSIRVRAAADLTHPLVLREIAIDSDPPIALFRYPVEFVVDVADAPEMKAWADDVARLCERWYPRLNDELKTEGYKPARVITMTLKDDYKGVAAASGSRITGSVKFFRDHPEDRGAMIHETVHVVQRYRGRRNPGWLVEGVADYVRFFVFEPGKVGPVNPARARYDASYRTTAAFLAYVAEKFDREIVLKLNKAMREGTYQEALFKEITGKTVQELGEEWRASLRHDKSS